MTIRRLTKEESRTYRRKFLADVAYVMFCDALKRWHSAGRTSLTDIEITLAASDFCHDVLSLPDVEEGLPCEMDYLEEDAESQTDAMLIMLVASAMLQAWGTHHEDIDTQGIISTIYKRWAAEEKAMELLVEASQKEEERWQRGKRNSLLEYELQQAEREEDGCSVAQMMDELLSPTFGKSAETIKGMLLLMGKCNMDTSHAYDAHIARLYNWLASQGETASTSVGGDNHGMVVGGNLRAELKLSEEQLAAFMQGKLLNS